MKLYHNDNLVCDVIDVSKEGTWMNGSVQSLTSDAKYLALFKFLNSEELSSEEPPFPEEMLDPENWYIIDSEGDKRGIEVPSIENQTIAWRWS